MLEVGIDVRRELVCEENRRFDAWNGEAE